MTSVKLFVLACGVAIGMSACGGGGTSVDYQNGATYTEALSGDPGNLHPLRAVQQSTFRLIPFAYDSLINLHSKGKGLSQLAQKWQGTAPKAAYHPRPRTT